MNILAIKQSFSAATIGLIMATSIASAAFDWHNAASAKIKLHTMRIAVLHEKYREIDNFYQVLAWERKQLDDTISQLASNVAPASSTGTKLEAYTSQTDGSSQPFWTYTPINKSKDPGLLVYLHCYNPAIDILTAPGIPLNLRTLADQAGAYAVTPFGRGNTDYQQLGEIDVLDVIDEMVARYGIDKNKIVLCGNSMGGLGAWCVGARHADLFNAVVVISGRADFYVWHKLSQADIPPWHNRIIENQFATRYLPNLTNTLIAAIHGELDDVVTYDQGVFPVTTLRKLGARNVSFVSLPLLDHAIFESAMANATICNAILRGLSEKLHRPSQCFPAPAFPGDSGSRSMNALLEPFVLVAGGCDENGYTSEAFKARISEWNRYAHVTPYFKDEKRLTMQDVTTRNLIVFGEPETSPLIKFLLRCAGAATTPTEFQYAGKTLLRKNRGLILTLRNPYNTNHTAIVQCGIPWCAGQADNHRFDRIPDVICYTSENDSFGYPVADEAGFLTSSNTIDWSEIETKHRPW